MSRTGGLVARIRRDGLTAVEYRRVCVVAFALLCIIVVSGAAVRLTGSGLGCDDWPECNDERLIDVTSGHAAIEQVNRLFTGLVAVGVVVAVLGSMWRRPRRRDLVLLSWGLVAGVVGQILLGAVVVKLDLHPVVVQGHFVLSMVLVANAVVLIHRAGLADGGRRLNTVLPRTKGRVNLLVVWTALAILAGTIVTGSGPHAGDEDVERLSFLSISWATRLHGAIVWITVAVAASLVWHLRSRARDRAALDGALVLWFCLAVAQGFVGYWQYATGVPAGLVALHVTGATALWSATVWMRCVTVGVSHSVDDLADAALGESRRDRRPGSALDSSGSTDAAGDLVDDLIAKARRGRKRRS